MLIKGTFNNQNVFLLDNQANQGRLGYRVLQIVQSNQHAFLVNLGWVQGSINRKELPSFNAVSGTQQFNGHIRIIEKGIVLQEQILTENQWPLRIQQVDIKKIAQLLGLKLLPFVVYVNKDEKIGFKKNWQPIVMPPEKHQAYAFQWFSLAAAWLILMIWAWIKNSRTDVSQ